MKLEACKHLAQDSLFKLLSHSLIGNLPTICSIARDLRESFPNPNGFGCMLLGVKKWWLFGSYFPGPGVSLCFSLNLIPEGT
jgi:hypothetical protein